MGVETTVPFYSSMGSHDWQRLGYPSREVARFWDTRSCGVACLRMAYGYLGPATNDSPARITEELLRLGAYSEAKGWKHLGLAHHARLRGLAAHLVSASRPDELWLAATTPGVLIVSVGSSFDIESCSGHLAVVVGFAESGDIVLHRPSGQSPSEGFNLRVHPDTFWEHFSGRGIHISQPEKGGGGGLCRTGLQTS
ncbi:hypothetical protein [Paenarthrobacter aurescens]|uniref:hypothetical protein n=1 Tax=Paenarthrobacter aurescens TaxID=43663 RepID=UPI0005C1AB4F|nr:hypothetical protein [Paenarthrobacter aurescens]